MRARDLLSRSRFLLGVKMFDGAIDVCNSLLASDAQCSAALLVRASAYKELGNADAAIADLDEYIQQKPESGRGYSLRGLVYALKDKYISEQAFADFQKSQELAPKNAMILFHFEELFLCFDKAKIFSAIKVLPRKMKMQLLDECLDKNSYFGEQFSKQRGFNECSIEAGVLKKIHRYRQRIKSWTAAQWEFLGDKKQREGKYDAAVFAYSDALQMVSDEKLKVPLYIERGNVFFRLKQEQEALGDYQLALALDPYCAGAHINRAALLSIDPSPEKLAAGIEAYEAIQQLIADGKMVLTERELAILNQGIAAIFDMPEGKKKVFEAIKCFDEEKRIILLKKCLLNDHYLGAHFWKKKSMFTSDCSLEKGTLGEIQSYLRRLEGQDEPDARPSVVDRFIGFFSPASSSHDTLEMQHTRRSLLTR